MFSNSCRSNGETLTQITMTPGAKGRWMRSVPMQTSRLRMSGETGNIWSATIFISIMLDHVYCTRVPIELLFIDSVPTGWSGPATGA